MAVRIVGVDLPQNKRGEIALTYISLRRPVLTKTSKYRTGPTLRQPPCVR